MNYICSEYYDMFSWFLPCHSFKKWTTKEITVFLANDKICK